jgi:ankyrin repeat protein
MAPTQLTRSFNIITAILTLGLTLTLTVSVTASPADDKTLALIEAVKAGQIDKVKELLNSCADVNAKEMRAKWDSSYGGPGIPLKEAIDAGNLEMISLLLDSGATVNPLNKDVFSPLKEAIRKDNPEMVDLLLKKGADADAAGGGFTPLLEAACRSNVKIAGLLVDMGAVTGTRRGAFRHEVTRLEPGTETATPQPRAPSTDSSPNCTESKPTPPFLCHAWTLP